MEEEFIKHSMMKYNGCELYIEIDIHTNSMRYIVIDKAARYIYKDFDKAKEIFDKLTIRKTIHNFQFETNESWEPQTSACWTECPFAFNINLSETCRCFNKDYNIACPFIKEGLVDEE